ncbi:MAG: hypothetical protein V4695_06955 [Pseudomonadota bacterium]
MKTSRSSETPISAIGEEDVIDRTNITETRSRAVPVISDAERAKFGPLTRASAKKRRASVLDNNLGSLPMELHQRIAANFTSGSGDAVRLSCTDKKLNESLKDQTWVEKQVHRAQHGKENQPYTAADLQQVLQDPALLDNARRPLQMRAQVLRTAIKQIGVVCRTPEEAATILAASTVVLKQLDATAQPADQKLMVQLLISIAREFAHVNFRRAVQPNSEAGAHVAAGTQEFFCGMQSMVEKQTGPELQRLETMMANGMYMIGDSQQRLAIWKKLSQQTDHGSPHIHARVLALANAIRFLPIQPDREAARRALMLLLPDLPIHERAAFIAALMFAVGQNTAHPQQADLVKELWDFGLALPTSHTRSAVITATVAMFETMQAPIRVTSFRSAALALEALDQADRDACLPFLAASIRHLPEPIHRQRAMVFCVNRIAGLSEHGRIRTLKVIVPVLALMAPEELRLHFFSQICHDVQRLSPQARTSLIPGLGQLALGFQQVAQRQLALGDLLLLISQTEGVALRTHLVEISCNAKNLHPIADAAHTLHWAMAMANRLPIGDRAEVFAVLANQAFASVHEQMPVKVIDDLCTQMYEWPTADLERVHEAIRNGIETLITTVRDGVEGNRTSELQVGSFATLCSMLQRVPKNIAAAFIAHVTEVVVLAHGADRSYASDFMRKLETDGLLDRCMAMLPQLNAANLRALLPVPPVAAALSAAI